MSTEAIDTARDEMHRAGVADRMRELSRKDHVDADEALAQEREPSPATWDDVELHMLGKPCQIAAMRTRLDAHRSTWLARVVATHEERIETLEREWLEHLASHAHEQWLSSEGPHRLWNTLNELRLNAEQRANVVREAKGDARAFEAIAELHAWQQAEMVRLFLNQAAAE